MGKLVKFSSQIDKVALEELRAFVKETDRSISGALTEAVRQYLDSVRVRPEFRKASDEVIEENSELLRRLAK